MKALLLNSESKLLVASLLAQDLEKAGPHKQAILKGLLAQLNSEEISETDKSVPVVLVRRKENDEMVYAASQPVHLIYLEDDIGGDFDEDDSGCVKFFDNDCWITQVSPSVEDFTEYLAVIGNKSL
ncbi:hypothetical protein AB2D15_34225 [Pseudomonas aeruginosa]